MTTDIDTTNVARCFVEAWRYRGGQYPGHILAQDSPVAVAQAAVGEKRVWLHATAIGRPRCRATGSDDGVGVNRHAVA